MLRFPKLQTPESSASISNPNGDVILMTNLSSPSKWNSYRTIAFIDANIVLEGKQPDKLPWAEIDPVGPVLVLVLPQVQKEIDSKKRDGRLQTHARAFNRLIAPSAVSGAPVPIVDGVPKVDLALARCEPIPWISYDDLDPTEGDCKVIAELLHVLDVVQTDRMLISADIYPISMASRRGIRTFHAKDSWLRQAEPGPADKEMQRLKGRIAELESREPQIDVELKFLNTVPDAIQLYRVEDLTDDERKQLIAGVLKRNPKTRQSGPEIGIAWQIVRDSSYDGRYAEYKEKTVPEFVGKIVRTLEGLYAQTPFSLTVSNIGKVQAENLIIEVETSNGWFQEKLFFRNPKGPAAPQPRDMLDPMSAIRNINFARDDNIRVGAHDVILNPQPVNERKFAVQCQDFRHGRTWKFEGVLRLDPRVVTDAQVTLRTTTSNMRGEILKTIRLNQTINNVRITELMDLRTGDRAVRFPMENVLDEAIRTRKFDAIRFPKSDD